MTERYDPSAVEAKWRKKWEEARTYDVDLTKAKDPYYALVMFPYPSGARLHVGHWYQYGPTDSFARYMKMQGKDVFFPMGFDAFGLPAENYAIKTGTPPAKSTAQNVTNMIAQYKRMGTMYDWRYALNTSEPEYYRWTQWLFLQMYRHKLAYKKLANVNWCPKDQTVLANEQAQDGLCERCGTPVVQKALSQWFWKITDYSQRLLDGLDDLDWPEKTKTMQRNWIGKKTGINITYKVDGSDDTITCFTTRPDTNFGATFIVLAPEHAFAQKTAESNDGVKKYIEAALKKTELDRQEEGMRKTGAFTGHYAINNLNGRKIPIWVSDFVLGGFGTGAVVGVPGHDLRDFQFATTFDIPIIRVVVASDGDMSDITKEKQVQEEEGTMVNSDFLDGMEIMQAKEKIMDYLEKKGWGKRVTTYRLRDWLVSRQRYWGAPIPIVYDPEGNPHPIPEEHLPWMLPTDVEFKPTGESPLKSSKEFHERTEKIFGKGWTPEYDTMDTFVCSSFYQFQFLAGPFMEEASEGGARNAPARSSQLAADSSFVDPAIERTWMPVDTYIGGPEHACMHLIYARFVTMALKDFGFVSVDEPFKKLVHQGLVTNQGAKMSKSRGNVVDPDPLVEKFGADVFRMYLMFMGPYTDGGDWSDSGIKGIERFAQRLYRLFVDRKDGKDDKGVLGKLHAAIKKVGEDIEAFRFNTAISTLMEFLNLLEGKGSASAETLLQLSIILSPLAPHLAEELFEMSGGKGFAFDQKWPTYDPKFLVQTTVTIAVQVNGKLRAQLEVAPDISESDVIAQAKADENVAKHLGGREPKKAIYVKGRLVSLVV